MQLRTYKGLIRFILFLISFQFFSLATTPGEATVLLPQKTYNLQAEHSKAFSLSVFMEENKAEKEGEDEKLLHCFEIADFSFVSQLLTSFHSPHVTVSPIEQQYDLKPPLFKLYKIYII